MTNNVDRVDYLGGATFITNENSKKHNGITLGSYINMNIRGEIQHDFMIHITQHDPMYMHEYGHYLDSQRWGLIYLFAIGVPSGISALGDDNAIIKWNGKSVSNPYRLNKHDIHWAEMRANRLAKKYFENHYGINWEKDVYPKRYPTKNPFK
ncbi:MAG: hypothetical protein Q4G63_12345 [Bacteroidia bacterium]|nr:hypothetical protein [Bacteroidia bacterium]